MSKSISWGITHGSGTIVCECEQCGNEVTHDFEDGPDFTECQETIKSFGWISRKINGEWYDFCCYACYKKFEAKMKGVKA